MTKSARRKVAARKARSAQSKTTSKRSSKARSRNQKTPQKVAAKLRNNVAAEMIRQTHQMIDAPVDQFRRSQVTDTLRVFAERNVAQTRELYEGSKNTLQTVLESWQKSFGAAGISLNRKIIDIADRNINIGFDLATDLAGAKNLAEVMELQAAYWHKIAGTVQTQSKARAARRNQ
jgi:hypothetical protein